MKKNTTETQYKIVKCPECGTLNRVGDTVYVTYCYKCYAQFKTR